MTGLWMVIVVVVALVVTAAEPSRLRTRVVCQSVNVGNVVDQTKDRIYQDAIMLVSAKVIVTHSPNTTISLTPKASS